MSHANSQNHNNEGDPACELDLRGVICPYNFVKTKLQLEAMESGELLAVILDDGEPIRNVPESIRNEGHIVVRQEAIGQAFRVLIRKK
ncbi:MAG: sulfurtransferase TusA family protein [Nitrospirae bacterium]|nr:MAG: sulfurtransferase TusA family protein [Nitrospirota bacterium]